MVDNRKHLDTAEDFKPIPQVMDFDRSIEIPPKLLATVTSLSPDGGDLAYLYAMSEWDGEDDQFEIKSIEGIEHLVNLEEFTPLAMITAVDYTPILGCKKLKLVDMSYAKTGKRGAAVKAELLERGVDITEE